MNDFYNPYNNYFNNNFMNHSNAGIIKVNGINGANAYQMKPNEIVALFDENNDYFYVKSTDGAGFTSIRTFKFEEVKDSTNTFVTVEEYNKGMNELKELIENGFKSVRTES